MAAKKSRLFEYVDAVSNTKNDAFLRDPEWEREYVPFIVNRAFSYHIDSVMSANMMNERAHLTKELQALFYLHTLRPRKRFSPWHKSTHSAAADKLAEYYGCSRREAQALVALHTEAQLEEIERRLFKGGV